MVRARGRAFWSDTLGPGLLFAGAAVGVSHLVQSTRAGAEYGFSLVLIILAANLLKYPAFAFGPRYAAATGTSILEGYRRQGRWALVLYAILTVGTMFTVLAVVTVVTAGIAKALLELEASVAWISAFLLVAGSVTLAVGRYRVLDRFMKPVVALLTIMTVTAAALVVPTIDWSEIALWPTTWNHATSSFVAPLVGWMPSAVDVAVWHSLWTLAKRRDSHHAPSIADAMLDFNIGYIGTALLAICFLVMGAGLLYGTGQTVPVAAGAFANQVIDLYATALGGWSRYLIGSCALAVMISTTITVLDGFPRALAGLVERFRCAEVADADDSELSRRAYWVAVLVLSAGATVILFYVQGQDFKRLVDLATALAFLTAPVLAILNHRSVFAGYIPADRRPGAAMRAFSLASIVLLIAFAIWWLATTYLMN